MLFQSLFQLDDTEFSLQTAVKARKKLEDEVNDLQSQVDSLCKSKKEVRFLPLRLPSMCSPVPLSLLLCLVGWLVGWLVLSLGSLSHILSLALVSVCSVSIYEGGVLHFVSVRLFVLFPLLLLSEC